MSSPCNFSGSSLIVLCQSSISLAFPNCIGVRNALWNTDTREASHRTAVHVELLKASHNMTADALRCCPYPMRTGKVEANWAHTFSEISPNEYTTMSAKSIYL
jgi:hypothetical protein